MKNCHMIAFTLFFLAGTLFAGQLSTTPASKMNWGWWKNRFEQNCKNARKGGYDIVFLGDSITDFWRNRGKKEFQHYFGAYKTLNMGYSADRTENVLWRLDNGELDGAEPKLIVLMIGTNNLGHRPKVETTQDTVDGIRAILDRIGKISPKSKVLLLGIFPRAATRDAPFRVRNDAVNAQIAKFADNKRIFWMDLGPKFLDARGNLPRSVMPDLLHPNGKGYVIWAEAILPFVKKTVPLPAGTR